jgi:hypothetical protein
MNENYFDDCMIKNKNQPNQLILPENDINITENKLEIRRIDSINNIDSLNNKMIDAETQTDSEFMEKQNDELNNEKNKNKELYNTIVKLQNENTIVSNNLKEMIQLVNYLTKINDTDNTLAKLNQRTQDGINNQEPNIDSIKNKITLMANRDLRLRFAFPFTSILSRNFKY